jgi:hypothetical protein
MTSTERLAADPEPQTAPLPDGAVRCTHADREQTASRLHEATGDGRLTMDETEERLGRVYAARYHHELDALKADLAAPNPSPVGWALVATHLRRQLLDDLAVLVGRVPGTPGQRIRILLVALTVLMVTATAVLMMLHGVFADGPGFEPGHHFDRD